MKFIYSVAALPVLIASVLAETINTPTNLVQCEPALISWSSGTTPYFLTVYPGTCSRLFVIIITITNKMCSPRWRNHWCSTCFPHLVVMEFWRLTNAFSCLAQNFR